MPTLPGRRPQVLLEVDLTTAPLEREPQGLVDSLQNRGRTRLHPLVRTLYDAAEDRHVVGLIAKVGRPLPWSRSEEIRLAVRAFAASGKPTVAWSETFGEEGSSMAAYVLATGFGEVWLQPTGELGALGVGLETTFLRGTLDKLGVEPQFEQRYEYKNAADRITRTGFTPAHREAMDRLVESIYSSAVGAIADGRRLSEETVRELVDGGPWTAAEAAAAGLVDRLGYRDEAYAALRGRLGDDIELLYADRWHRQRTLPERLPVRHRKHVAYVEAAGGIVVGRSRRGPMGREVGSDSIAAQLRAAARDDSAAAVVLRVESPGGSAVASDVIWREVGQLREAGKPVIVSMGDVAASGGYYIACPADVIVALPSTLTGSIGVLGGKLITEQLRERAGLGSGTVSRGEHALMYSARRRFTEEEQQRFATLIDTIYTDFVGKVAAGRHRSYDEIHALAKGRVWSGQDAYDRGLVDELGGLRDAVRIARERAGLPDRAPVLPAIRLPKLARLGRPRNSEDPRALAASARTTSSLAATAALVTGSSPVTATSLATAGLADFLRTLGVPADATLRMPPITLR